MIKNMLNLEGDLELVFRCLADPTRRQMVMRLYNQTLSFSELAKPYEISKRTLLMHLRILEKAGFVKSSQKGKKRVVDLDAKKLQNAWDYLRTYEEFMSIKLDNLEKEMRGEQEGARSYLNR